MPRTRWFVAGAPLATVVAAAALLLAPRPADAEPARPDGLAVGDPAPEAVLAPLVDPVGRLAGAGFDRLAATTASMIAVATPAPPPPPPPVPCPAPEATFVDTWGAPRSGGRRHKGVDMMAAHGSPVVAPVGGEIRASNSSLGGLGFWLEADDGNTYFGSHLASLSVRGGRVEAGAPIGTVGSTGNAGGTPHLHFEVMLPGKVSVNPYPLVAQWCPSGVQ
jgi:murein DD-endopeptidase MepM/ murein hydrolase activator NlpD